VPLPVRKEASRKEGGKLPQIGKRTLPNLAGTKANQLFFFDKVYQEIDCHISTKSVTRANDPLFTAYRFSGASRSFSRVNPDCMRLFLIATARAFFDPTMTTSSFALVAG
jgi:hypothetical protein